jgi:DUF438 domain-containing protein
MRSIVGYESKKGGEKMDAVKTIDPRGLPHHEREALIFPGIEGLKWGEGLRLILEFNPLPLVHMLNARNEFGISYEKQGPDEWILMIRRHAPQEDRIDQFKKILHELKEGKISEEAKKKAKNLLQAVDAKTLGIMEQELIREGISHEEVRKSLCDIHLEVLRDSLVAKRIEVTAPHPVNTFMEEHKIILQSLNDLVSLVERLRRAGSFEDMGKDMEKLKEISHHLVEAESHHQREEEVLFPKLEKHDIAEPARIMKMDHEEFRKRKRALYQLAQNPEDQRFVEFKEKVIDLGEYLTRELESHIFKEDNILYQIALQVLTDQEWQEAKREADKIGYCCFRPQDQKH